MNEQEALRLMKAPRDKRDGIWRNGVLQIWVTRACDKACFGCTQGSNLGGKPGMMTVDQFAEACDSLMLGPTKYWGVVGVFGGNPALNPGFEDMCKVMRGKVPFEQRGLWCNHPKGKGKVARITFNPRVSNLNVHLDQEAHDEFSRDWPECRSELKGLDTDSRHSPVYVAMQDVLVPSDSVVTRQGIREGISDDDRHLSDGEVWTLASGCDVNQRWSAMIGVFRGELRGWFCEIAGAQAMIHQHEPDYPDTGCKIEHGWWDRGMESFADQARYHCRACGFPLRGYGELAIDGKTEQVSQTHAGVYKPKTKDRLVELVVDVSQTKPGILTRGTDYVENGRKFK